MIHFWIYLTFIFNTLIFKLFYSIDASIFKSQNKKYLQFSFASKQIIFLLLFKQVW